MNLGAAKLGENQLGRDPSSINDACYTALSADVQYIKLIEDKLTFEEISIINVFLKNLEKLYDGTSESFNKMTGEIFTISNNAQIVDLVEVFKKKTGKNIRDFLLTKILVSRPELYKYLEGSGSENKLAGVIAKKVKSVLKSYSLELEHDYEDLDDISEEEIKEEAANLFDNANFLMDPDALILGESFGNISPPHFGNFNTEIRFPTMHGYKIIDFNTEHLPIRKIDSVDSSQYEVQKDEIVIELVCRSFDVIPVPGDYEIVANLGDKPLEVIDPTAKTPMLTFSARPIFGEKLKYVIRKKRLCMMADPKPFRPNDKEQEDWQKALPLPKEVAEMGSKNETTACMAVLKFMAKNFTYVCDEKLGMFIQNHTGELSLLMDGLRVGHCNLLAWTAAGYLRQMGLNAVVTHVEASNDTGTAFSKVAHARVAVIKENGQTIYLDPTIVCPVVNGYRLGSVPDEVYDQLEKDFSKAKDENEKKLILQNFKQDHIDGKQDIGKPLSAHIAEPSVFFAKGIQDGDISDLEARLSSDFINLMHDPFNSELSNIDINIYNAAVDVLAPYGVTATFEALSLLNRMGKEAIVIDPCEGLIYEREMRKISSPENSAELSYDHDLARYIEDNFNFPDEPCNFSRYELRQYCKFGWEMPEDFKFLPDMDSSTADNYDNVDSKTIASVDRIGTKMQNMLYAKFMVRAFTDPKNREILDARFGKIHERLKIFAKFLEPHLACSKPRKEISKKADKLTLLKKLKDNFSPRVLRNRLCFDLKEYERGMKKFGKMLRALKLKAETPSCDDYEIEYETYDSAKHDASNIDWNASARTEKPLVKIKKFKPTMEKKLHVYLDSDQRFYASGGTSGIDSLYGNCRVMLEALGKYSRENKIRVLVTSSSFDYIELDPAMSDDDLNMLAIWLVTDDHDSARNNFKIGKNMPKNLLYLSDSEGSINAAQYSLRGQTNLIAKKFDEVGLEVFPRLKPIDQDTQTLEVPKFEGSTLSVITL